MKYDLGLVPILAAVFTAARLREKATTFRIRNAAVVSVLAFLCGVAAIFGRRS